MSGGSVTAKIQNGDSNTQVTAAIPAMNRPAYDEGSGDNVHRIATNTTTVVMQSKRNGVERFSWGWVNTLDAHIQQNTMPSPATAVTTVSIVPTSPLRPTRSNWFRNHKRCWAKERGSS